MSQYRILQTLGLVLFISLKLFHSYAAAYQVGTTSSGAIMKWSSDSATYYVNTSGGPSGSLAAIQAAMETWTNVPTSVFSFVYGGTTTSTAWGTSDNKNIVTFGSMGTTGTLAQNDTWYYASTGEIIDSDIKINTDYPYSTSGSSGYFDLQGIATHELGHSLHLDDLYSSADSAKTMYGKSAKGDSSKRTLDQDDMNGITYLYPNPSDECFATLSDDFLNIHIPIASYASRYYTVEMQYTNRFDFKLTDATELTDISDYSSCLSFAPTFSLDLDIHMPVLMYEGYSYWADFMYKGNMIFTMTDAGGN